MGAQFEGMIVHVNKILNYNIMHANPWNFLEFSFKSWLTVSLTKLFGWPILFKNTQESSTLEIQHLIQTTRGGFHRA